jgi:hypothetical protein
LILQGCLKKYHIGISWRWVFRVGYRKEKGGDGITPPLKRLTDLKNK